MGWTFLPYKKFDIVTNLSAEEIKQKISSHLNEERPPLPWFTWTGYQYYTGSVNIKDDCFELERIVRGRYTPPTVSGTIEKRLSKNVIHVKISMDIYDGLFLFIGMFGFFALKIILHQIKSDDFSFFGLFILGTIAFLYLFALFRFNSEITSSRAFLKKILEAERPMGEY